jgi:small subunit ribosomal protein S17
MADDEKNETTEDTETPAAEVAEVASDTEVSDTVEAPAAEVVSDTEVSDTVEAPAAEVVSDTEVSDTVEAPAAEVVPDTVEAPAAGEEEAPAAPVRKQKSLKHVPRSQRRTRSKPKREAPATRKPVTRTEKPETERGRRQERRGVVVSDKGDKTIVVKVDLIKSHPKYRKVVRSTVKFHAHDEQNQAGVGDTVRIVETRPLSKTKHWRLAEIVEKAR